MRTATPADLDTICESLRKAFWDDPIMRFVLPDGAPARERRMRGLMHMEAKSAIGQGTVFLSGDRDAAAIWKAPGKWKVGGAELVRQLPQAIGVFRGSLPRALSALSTFEKKHPTEPHWYLAILGTDPEAQGKGKGSAVMQPILERCDDEGVPAYLESSKEQNVPFYERHGFRVTEVVELPKGGPKGWLMWRDPR